MLDVADRMSETTRELFASMIGLRAVEGPLIDLPHTAAGMEIVAFVGLSGTSAGMLGVYASGALARQIAGGLLGEEPAELDDEVRDAFGEVANIIAGNVAIALGDVGQTIQLSLPSVIVGKFLVTTIVNTVPPRRAKKFSVDGEDFYVELALRTDED